VVGHLPPDMWVTWVQFPCMKGTTSSRGPQARPPYLLYMPKSLWIKASAKCINIYRLQIQVAEMSFLEREAGLSLGDKARSAAMQRELKSRLLLLHIHQLK